MGERVATRVPRTESAEKKTFQTTRFAYYREDRYKLQTAHAGTAQTTIIKKKIYKYIYIIIIIMSCRYRGPVETVDYDTLLLYYTMSDGLLL